MSKLVTLYWTSWIFNITPYLTLHFQTINGMKVEIHENHHHIHKFIHNMNLTKIYNSETSRYVNLLFILGLLYIIVTYSHLIKS
jgi:hypothetical protein